MHSMGFGQPRFPQGNPRDNNAMPQLPQGGPSPFGQLPPQVLQQLMAARQNQMQGQEQGGMPVRPMPMGNPQIAMQQNPGLGNPQFQGPPMINRRHPLLG